MKLLRIAFILLLFASCESFDTDTNLETAYVPNARAEDMELTDHIDDVLKKMYPKIGRYKILIKQKTCVVDFIMGGNIYQVKFDLDGIWRETKVDIAYEFTLPEKIQTYLKRDEFKGWILSEKQLDQTPDEISYKFVFKRGEELMSIWLDHNGNVLKDKTDTEQIVK